jgi:deoxyhypusine synthase
MTMDEKKTAARKGQALREPVKHIDVTGFDATPIMDSMREMSFSAREVARAADLLGSIILTIAGSSQAAGCMQLYADMLRFGMADVVVATGAAIVDMDFFEALGFRHYKGSAQVDDSTLREMYIDRIYDTFIDEEQLQQCDLAVKAIADSLPAGVYSSRAFIREMGRYLGEGAKKRGSLVETAFQEEVPVFCPAFSDSSAGFGLVMHQVQRPEAHVSIDSVRDFRELTRIKIEAQTTGLFMVGGGVPKNFAQDTVVCAEVLGRSVPMHKYAVQITVADVRDGACSSSTLKEAGSWGKVGQGHEQMVFAEATTVLPLIVSYAYHRGEWKARTRRRFSRLFS